jgi:hypothetical protein
VSKYSSFSASTRGSKILGDEIFPRGRLSSIFIFSLSSTTGLIASSKLVSSVSSNKEVAKSLSPSKLY